MVIVPAALFLARDFAQIAEGRTVIFYDMRNRGRSEAVQDPARLTIQDDVRDLEAVRAHFRARRFSAIGYSYLGMMVMLYAMQHPDRIERVIQLGPVILARGAREVRVDGADWLADVGFGLQGLLQPLRMDGRECTQGGDEYRVVAEAAERVLQWRRREGWADLYAFVPEDCVAGHACGLLLALHGCLQSHGAAGMSFIERAGINQWADGNAILVLYAQATAYPPSSLDFGNPLGCWNWWGYAGDKQFLTKQGVQVGAIWSMVQRVTGQGN